MRRVLVIAFAAWLVVPAAASACTVAARPAEERVRDADRAVFAKVVRRTQVGVDDATGTVHFRYRLRVLETYKGTIRRRITILAHDNDGTCGFGPLERGKRLGLVLAGRRGPWRVGLGNLITRRELRSVRAPKEERR
ncbi:MAG TPA: hypothetical protein VHF89_00210 [Solirubrobacteraceae bacterium]|nr:hypothetical protein [Solirubrobacteraceae bacterium]